MLHRISNSTTVRPSPPLWDGPIILTSTSPHDPCTYNKYNTMWNILHKRTRQEERRHKKSHHNNFFRTKIILSWLGNGVEFPKKRHREIKSDLSIIYLTFRLASQTDRNCDGSIMALPKRAGNLIDRLSGLVSHLGKSIYQPVIPLSTTVITTRPLNHNLIPQISSPKPH